MERKTLEDYLLKSNLELLAEFKYGVQGQNDFGQFMNLIRKQQNEINELKIELYKSYHKGYEQGRYDFEMEQHINNFK